MCPEQSWVCRAVTSNQTPHPILVCMRPVNFVRHNLSSILIRNSVQIDRALQEKFAGVATSCCSLLQASGRRKVALGFFFKAFALGVEAAVLRTEIIKGIWVEMRNSFSSSRFLLKELLG